METFGPLAHVLLIVALAIAHVLGETEAFQILVALMLFLDALVGITRHVGRLKNAHDLFPGLRVFGQGGLTHSLDVIEYFAFRAIIVNDLIGVNGHVHSPRGATTPV
jgi:hypothetical protein